MRSTAPRPKSNPPCWKSCRNNRSPSASTPTRSQPRSWSWPPRTRSSPQTPTESDGTHPLPEAQVDRFLMKVVVDYPNFSEEMTIVARSLTPPPAITTILSLEQLQALQAHTTSVYVDRLVAEYAVALCDATRQPATYQLPDLAGYIAYGASPRGSINLVAAARALAVLRGRSYCLPQDVQELARDVLRHRLVLTYQ